MMIGVYNHLLSKVFRLPFSEGEPGSLGTVNCADSFLETHGDEQGELGKGGKGMVSDVESFPACSKKSKCPGWKCMGFVLFLVFLGVGICFFVLFV